MGNFCFFIFFSYFFFVCSTVIICYLIFGLLFYAIPKPMFFLPVQALRIMVYENGMSGPNAVSFFDLISEMFPRLSVPPTSDSEEIWYVVLCAANYDADQKVTRGIPRYPCFLPVPMSFHFTPFYHYFIPLNNRMKHSIFSSVVL